MQLLVIGGSDAGIAAGLRARELDPGVEVTVVLADAYPSFSVCGLPYPVSGETPDWRDLAHRSRADLEARGLRLLPDHTALRIDPDRRVVTVRTPVRAEHDLSWDRLVVATGAEPVLPPIEGIDTPGVHVLTPWTTASPCGPGSKVRTAPWWSEPATSASSRPTRSPAGGCR